MFTTHKMEASNGDSWWAFFECDLDFSLAVSEVSPDDARMARQREMIRKQAQVGPR